MKQIDRIAQMERCLDVSEEAVQKLSDALDFYEANQKSIRKLFDYYGSTLWMKDFEDDEAGKLPADLKIAIFLISAEVFFSGIDFIKSIA